MLEKFKQYLEAIIVGVPTAIGISFVLFPFYPPESKDALLSMGSAVASLIVGGVMSYLILHLQKKNDQARDSILQDIHTIIDNQNRIHLSHRDGHTAVINSYLSELRIILTSLQDDTGMKQLHKFISNKEKEITYEVNSIMFLVSSDLTTKIFKVLDHCKEITNKNIGNQQQKEYIEKERDKAITIIDKVTDSPEFKPGKIDDPLHLENFENIDVSSLFENPRETVIVVGSKRDSQNRQQYRTPKDDYAQAKKFRDNKLTGCEIKTDRQGSNVINNDGIPIPGITNEERKMRNLILIGGPSMNNLTKELHRKLPIQYMTTGRSGFLYSWISNRTYYNKCSVIEAVKNDETSEKITLVVFGLDRDDTKLAIDVLIKFDNSELKEGLKNTKNRSYPARVISEKESKSLIVEE